MQRTTELTHSARAVVLNTVSQALHFAMLLCDVVSIRFLATPLFYGGVSRIIRILVPIMYMEACSRIVPPISRLYF